MECSFYTISNGFNNLQEQNTLSQRQFLVFEGHAALGGKSGAWRMRQAG